MDSKTIGTLAVGGAAVAYCCLNKAPADAELDELNDVGTGESAGGGAALKLQLAGSGTGTTDDMAGSIPQDAVTFTILRQKFGAAGTKMVFIQVRPTLPPVGTYSHHWH